MANNINWGESYCNSWWGNSSNQSAIDNDSKPECMDQYSVFSASNSFDDQQSQFSLNCLESIPCSKRNN